MGTIIKLQEDLKKNGNREKAESSQRFFQTHKGGYGEGDKFLGVTVPVQRAIAKNYYKEIKLPDTGNLLKSEYHEERLTAVFILVLKYQKAKDEDEKQKVVNTYLDNIEGVDNWDIVDSSAHKILGPHLIDKDKKLLYEFLESDELWKQRIAIITTLHFIANLRYDDIFRMAEMMLEHKHDLIHKAVGWLLREVGKRDFKAEFDFLKKHYKKMPRTMLRYAIEKFDEELRQQFLKGTI